MTIPEVRPARFTDIPRLAELVGEMHARSVYADRATLDVKAFKALCVQAIQRHGKAACLFVAGGGGAGDAPEGFIMGTVDRLFGISRETYATDLFFYCSERSHAHSAGRLLDAFLGWAETAPGVIEIRLGVSGAIGDWRRAGALYRRRGMVADGAMYVRRIS